MVAEVRRHGVEDGSRGRGPQRFWEQIPWVQQVAREDREVLCWIPSDVLAEGIEGWADQVVARVQGSSIVITSSHCPRG